jgi:large subunit ribosomal protein L34e
MGDNRYTLRRSNPYRTRRNRVAPVRTPGNKLVAQYLVKRAKGPRCADTGKPLAGIPHLTTQKLKRLPKNKRTVARPYGGVLSGPVVRDRIINAFMEEEARAAAEKKAQAEKKQESARKKGK